MTTTPTRVAAITPHTTVLIDYSTDTITRHPIHPRSETVRVVSVPPPPPATGTQEIPATLTPPAPTPVAWRIAALACLLAVLAVRQTGPARRRMRRLLAIPTTASRLPAASAEKIATAVHAVRWAARYVPARIACLEESVAASLLLAVAGRRARWCHGIALDPIRLHAWLADPTTCLPIAEPDTTRLYTPITHIP